MIKSDTRRKYIFNLAALLIFWGGLLRRSYNYDTVYHMVVDDADVMTRIRGGRYAAALIDFALLKADLRTTSNISVTMLITFIVLAAALRIIQSLFERWQPEDKLGKAGFYCGLSLVFLNVLFAEPLMFGEYSVYYALAYLSAAIGVVFFTKKRYILMLIMYALAVSFYQNAAVFAAILSAFYIFLVEEGRLTKKAFVLEVAAIVSCMGMGILDLLSIRLLEKFNIIPASGKVSGLGDMKGKLIAALSNFISLNKNAAGIMPDFWLPLLFTAFLLAVIIYSLIKRGSLFPLPFLFIVLIGSFALSYVIPLASEEFYSPPRLSFCFFMVQGLLLAVSYKLTDKKLHKLLGVSGVLYLMLQLLFAEFIISDHFASNALDEAYTAMLCERLDEYEKESGAEVTKLAVMKDAYSPSSYSQVSYVSGQINERVIDAVPVSIIEVVSGRKLEKVEMPKSISDKYFKDKDWDYFDLDEQLVIEGDTAYWCIF